MKTFMLGFFTAFLLAAALDVSTAISPVAAAVDARSICYLRDASSGNWSISAPICPAINPAVLTGVSSGSLCKQQSLAIATPSGAFLTQLKADFKSLVLAAGYPSAD